MANPLQIIQISFHIIAITINTFILHYLPKRLTLSNLNVSQQIIYFILNLANDFRRNKENNVKKYSGFRKGTDFIFTTFIFPYGMYAGFNWTIHRFPVWNISDKVYFHPPMWLQHLLTTIVLLNPLVELFLIPHKYCKRIRALQLLLVIPIIYSVYAHIQRFSLFKIGSWITDFISERFLKNMSMMITIPIIFYFVGEILNYATWKFGRKDNKPTKFRKSLQNSLPGVKSQQNQKKPVEV